MMTDLIVNVHSAPGGPVLALAGGLDRKSADEFRAAVDALTLLPGRTPTVNLGALTFGE